MGQLVEIIFEALDKDQAKKVYEQIAGKKDSIQEDLNNLMKDTEANCIDTPLGGLTLNPDTNINNVHIRLLKYDNQKYDVEVNFDIDDILCSEATTIETAIFKYASSIANRNYVGNYFAGLEPASDAETRFFTGHKMGPYSLPK